MQKLFKVFLFIVALSIFILPAPSALAVETLIPTMAPYTTLPNGTPTTLFEWDQQPYTFIAFDGNLAEKSKLYMEWEWTYLGPETPAPSENPKTITQRFTIPAQQDSYSGIGGWSLNPDWWTANKTPGFWQVTMTWENWNKNSTTLLSSGGTAIPLAFTIAAAPEPVSTSLFLLGGGVMVAVKRLRKK